MRVPRNVTLSFPGEPLVGGFVGGFCYILLVLPEIGGRPAPLGTVSARWARRRALWSPSGSKVVTTPASSKQR